MKSGIWGSCKALNKTVKAGIYRAVVGVKLSHMCSRSLQ